MKEWMDEVRFCKQCGVDFTGRPEKIYCGITCRRAANKGGRRTQEEQESNELTFIGVDGEGVDRGDTGHDYLLLSVGDQSLWHRDGRALTFDEIAEFLWAQYLDHPGAVFIGFFLNYDFTHWIRSLPEQTAWRLLDPKAVAVRNRESGMKNRAPSPVEHGEWEFDLLPGKRFKLRQKGASAWMYICDTGSFWQTRFTNVIDPAGWEGHPVCTPEEYATILEGKNSRDVQTMVTPQMIRYNLLENEILARLTARLNEGMTRGVGVKLDKSQWIGPGQAAQKWMRQVKFPSRDALRDKVPGWALQAGRATYFGGWFEIFAHGHVPGTSYEYDINSAYPHIIAGLPDITQGEWSRGTGKPPDAPYLMVYAVLQGADPKVGPAMWRSRYGHVCRPLMAEGWYWWHEVATAGRAGLIRSCGIREWVAFYPATTWEPGGGVRGLYQRRLDVGKNSPEGKSLKLTYNSVAGKTAQSVGVSPYGCSIYASLITAGTRTQILEAIATHPTKTRDLLMVATDGVYFATPHPSLDISPTRLGAWDMQEKENLTLIMPGIHWSDSARKDLASGGATLKSRGVPAEDMERVVTEFDRLWTMDLDTWPAVDVTIGFSIVSAKQAIARGKWETCGQRQMKQDSVTGVWRKPVKTLSTNPYTKRATEGVPPPIGENGRRETMAWTAPTPYAPSTPYQAKFGQLEEDPEDDGITDDGMSPLYEVPSHLGLTF